MLKQILKIKGEEILTKCLYNQRSNLGNIEKTDIIEK